MNKRNRGGGEAENRTVYTSLVGMRASGKTTIAGLLALTAQEMAARKELRIEFDEKSGDIRDTVRELLKGEYPEPNQTGQNFISELTFRFERPRTLFRPKGEDRVVMSLGDVAGEDLNYVMDRIERGNYEISPEDMEKLRNINQHVLNANSFMLAIDVSSLKGKGMSDQATKLARFTDALLKYKSKVRNSPEVKAIGLFLAKFDKIENLPDCQVLSGSQEERRAILKKYMLPTAAAVRNFPDEVVRVFCSACREAPDGKVRMLSETNRPDYEAAEYEAAILWMKDRLLDA